LAPSEWQIRTVSQLAAAVRNALVGGPFGSDLVSADYVPAGVPVIRGQNMGPGRWVGGDFAYVAPEKAEKLSANLARPGDLIFTQRGQAVLEGGQVAIVPPGAYPTYLVSQSQMKLTPNLELVDVNFLYQFFKSATHAEYLRAHAIQTGVPHTNLGILGRTPVLLPPIAEQRAIARVLGALDDKIELNRKTNETLEAIARALFKSWFVDFDPVRAKMEGQRPVGMDEATAALFPDNFQASALGLVPQAWRVARLEDLVELRRGHDLPTSTRRPGRVPVVSSGGISGAHDVVQARAPGIVTGRYGTLGRVFLMEEDYWPLNTTLYSSDMKNNEPHFIFHALSAVDFEKYSDKGAVPGINRNHLHTEPMLIPPVAVQRAFAAVAIQLGALARARLRESDRLAELRDAMMPKLMSGELRVRDAARSVEAAT
jgi:type I restriction enzyme S subunit